MIVHVKCSFTIPVEVPDAADFNVHFVIEDNGCPATGIVGAALMEHMDRHEDSGTCWACALQGTCEIVEAP